CDLHVHGPNNANDRRAYVREYKRLRRAARPAISALSALSPNSELPLREIPSRRSASVPQTRSPASMTQLVYSSFGSLLIFWLKALTSSQRRNAPAQFVYDIVEMTDCILDEVINSSTQAYISALTGRLRLPQHENCTGSNQIGGNLRSTQRWNDV